MKDYNEKLNQAIAHLDSTKETLKGYDKKINQLNLDNLKKLTDNFHSFK